MLGFLQSPWPGPAWLPQRGPEPWSFWEVAGAWWAVSVEKNTENQRVVSKSLRPQGQLCCVFLILIYIILFVDFFGCVGFHCCRGLSLVLVRGATLYLWWTGFTLGWPVWLLSAGSRGYGLQYLLLLGLRAQAQ